MHDAQVGQVECAKCNILCLLSRDGVRQEVALGQEPAMIEDIEDVKY